MILDTKNLMDHGLIGPLQSNTFEHNNNYTMYIGCLNSCYLIEEGGDGVATAIKNEENGWNVV